MSRLMVWVPSCPQPLAAQSLVDTAIDFCRETGVLRYDIGPLDVQFGVSDYLLDPSGDMRIVRVLSASYRGAQLAPTPAAPADGAVGTPREISSPNSSQVRVYPAPDETQTSVLRVTATVTLSPAITEIPDVLYTDWLEAIVSGAAARISAIPDQPFTNPMVAAGAAMRYQQQLTRAQAEAAGPRILSNARVRQRPLA